MFHLSLAESVVAVEGYADWKPECLLYAYAKLWSMGYLLAYYVKQIILNASKYTLEMIATCYTSCMPIPS